ncbi:MAG: radical SAM protein [Magnetococcales bacterium]|nr:radical SAM protein [Magnetococcales bacterium]
MSGYESYRRPFPRVVRIEPSSACNLSCSHCPTGTVSLRRGRMKPDTFDRVVAQLRPHRASIGVAVLYHGGEPLLNKRFPAMIRSVMDLGIPHVKTVSNGMVLTLERARALIDSGLHAIEFSLDGEGVEENDFVRRKSDGATVIDNIRGLLALKKQLGVSHPDVAISQTRFARPEGFDRNALPEPAPYLLDAFADYSDQVTFKTTWAMRWPHMEVDPQIYDTFPEPGRTDDIHACDHVENTLTIASDGSVLACCYDLTRKLVMGSVLESSLEEIWNGHPYLALRKSIAEGNFHSICSRCATVRPGVFLRMKPGVIPIASGA